MRAVRRCSVPLASLAMILAGLVGTASASDFGVIQAVQTQSAKITSDPNFQKLGGLKIHNVAQARRAVRVWVEVEARFRAAARAVARTHGSTTLGTRGRADWIAGMRDNAYGYETWIVSARAYVRHDISASNAAYRRGERAFTQARGTVDRANRELRRAGRGLGARR